MLPSELFEFDALPVPESETARLPIYVDPLPGEALASWWSRLSRRFGLSARLFASAVMGIPENLPNNWAARPDDALIAMTSDRTGVSVKRLWSMTFLSWAPEGSQDEAMNRFGARRYLNRAAKTPRRGLVVCVECVRADRQPYVRLPWLVGWLAICPVHDVVMVSRCPGCRGALEVPVPGSRRVISADRCTRCGHRLVNESVAKALPAASALQDAMLIGKRTASLERAGIGSMAWPEFVMLSDLALGVFWCQTDGARKSTIGLALAQDEAGCDDLDIGNNREGCLVLLSWLLSTWVDGRAGEFVGEAWTRLVNEEWRSASANWGPSIEDVKLSQLGVLLSGLTH